MRTIRRLIYSEVLRAVGFVTLAFLALFFFGLAQCWLYAKTDRIWCPMLNHFLFNLTNLILLIVIPA